jgi:hypothetical protein
MAGKTVQLISHDLSRPGRFDILLGGAAGVLRLRTMELNQIKRFIKDLEERTGSLRRYL